MQQQVRTESVSLWRTIWGWVYPVLVGVAIALVLRRWVVDAAVVPTPSMVPTIPAPSYILVNKLATEFAPPYRGEVVVFHFPDDPSQIYVKRIIGLPGDTVKVTPDAVYVNGKRLYEPYIHVSNGTVLGTYHVPQGYYFMMGDNRPVSFDSRSWVHHYVARSAIIGQAEFVIFPFSEMHRIPQ